jgi:hypothetical protein
MLDDASIKSLQLELQIIGLKIIYKLSISYSKVWYAEMDSKSGHCPRGNNNGQYKGLLRI